MTTEDEATSEIRLLFQDLEDDPAPPSWSKTFLGYLAGVLNAVLASLGLICAHALGGLVPPFELNAWRFLAQLVLISPLLVYQRESIIPERKHVTGIGLVCMFVIGANLWYYTASTYLPVGTLGGFSPSVALISAALIKLVWDRDCSWYTAVSVVLCVGGVVLVIQPYFLFPDTNTYDAYTPVCRPHSDVPGNHTSNHSAFNASEAETSDDTISLGVTDQIIGYSMGAASGICATGVYTTVNRLLPDANVLLVSFWICGTCHPNWMVWKRGSCYSNCVTFGGARRFLILKRFLKK